MKPGILFVEQQGWRGGAQRVLGDVLRSIDGDCAPIVAISENGPFVDELRARGVETVFVPLGGYHAGAKSLADMAAFLPRSAYCALELAKIIRTRRIALVYINGPRCVVAGLLAARMTSTPSLFHLHMTLTRPTDLLVARWAARHATKTIACSESAAEFLAGRDRSLRNRLHVIYGAIRSPSTVGCKRNPLREPDRTLAESGQAVVGLVGRITPGKGHHVLLEAAARLRSAGRQIQIVFVGAPGANDSADASYVRHLKLLAREWHIESQLRWAGFQDDPNPFYSLMDVLVIPSTICEGLGLVALEALQTGVPVIGSCSGGIPEIVHDGLNGLLVPVGDAAALADALERLLSRPELRAKLRMGARASVGERFSYASFSKQIRHILDGLIAMPVHSEFHERYESAAGTNSRCAGEKSLSGFR